MSPVTISPEEFFLLWAAHHPVPDFPHFLGITPVGYTRSERAELTAAASDQLDQRGLGTIADPAPPLHDVMVILAHTPTHAEIAHRASGADGWAVAASRDTQAAVAVRATGTMSLWLQPTSGLAATLLDLVPSRGADRSTSANLSSPDFARAREVYTADGTGALQEMLRGTGIDRSEIATVRQALAAENGYGSLGISHRDEPGNMSQPLPEISWSDTETGRLVIRPDGDWVTITPADDARLRNLSTELLAASGVIEQPFCQ